MSDELLISLGAIAAVTVVLAIMAFQRPGRLHVTAVRIAGVQARSMLLRMALGVLAASFLAELLPKDMVADLAGAGSGWRGVLLATALGALAPTGPMVLMPVAVALIELGVGLPQIVAFLTSWGMLALHRVFVWEMPVMGWQFVVVRLAASVALVPACAYLAQFVEATIFR